jgi:hypothetical protein
MAKFTIGLLIGVIGTTGIWGTALIKNEFVLLIPPAVIAIIAVSVLHWNKS